MGWPIIISCIIMAKHYFKKKKKRAAVTIQIESLSLERWRVSHWWSKEAARPWYALLQLKRRRKVPLLGSCSTWRHQEAMAKLSLAFPHPHTLRGVTWAELCSPSGTSFSPSITPLPFSGFPPELQTAGLDSLPGATAATPAAEIISLLPAAREGRRSLSCPGRAVGTGTQPPHPCIPIPASPLPQVPSPSLCSGRRDFIFDLQMRVEMTHLIIHIHTHIPALCIYKGISFILIHESNLSSDADLANSVVAEMFPSCCPCPGL